METVNDVTRMRIVGGDLSLDFVNTRSGPPTGAADDDVLHGYDDLLAWAEHLDVLTGPEPGRLRRRARADHASAQAAYGRAIAARDHLDELFRATATGRRPAGWHLGWLREEAADAIGHAQLAPSDGRFQWRWASDQSLARPLWPVVHAAVQLLTTGPLDRVKACTGCRFLFVDESRNRSRRWCSMDDCGTAEKVRRYVARRAAARPAP